MYRYRSESRKVSAKWFTDKATDKDVFMADGLLNERAAGGREPDSCDDMAASPQRGDAFTVVFRREE